MHHGVPGHRRRQYVRRFFDSIRDVVGVDLDYETAGESMLMVSANGTAVRLE